IVVPLGAALLALLIGAVTLFALGVSPIEGYRAMFSGAFGSRDALARTALKAMPLLLVGSGICISFRASVINIGGEGQIVAGAILATILAQALPDLPSVLLITLVLLAGAVGGGIWGAIPGYLKAYARVNEILSTIMLNIVAVQIMNFLLKDVLIDPAEIERGTRIPQTERLSTNADLPQIPGLGRIHLGVLVAVGVAVLAWFLMWRTSFGFRLRAVGYNPDASRYAGMPVKRSTVYALTLSGAMAGVAGAVLVFGSESHRFVTDGSAAGFTGSAGFNGIVAALFGGLHPLWTIPSAFLFGGLLVGANAMQRAVQVPSALIIALNGLIVVFVVSSDRVRQLITRRAELLAPVTSAREEHMTEPPEGGEDLEESVTGG
ncbi:MAG TPA: ABC transporter permease, partial [Acidimicrobiales bacterium]|nr:ABC transporter permease [Acidimicrobiales bacterium]